MKTVEHLSRQRGAWLSLALGCLAGAGIVSVVVAAQQNSVHPQPRAARSGRRRR